MNITSAQYKNCEMAGPNSRIEAVVDGQTISVPIAPDNRHYQAILEWVAEGNEIQAAE